MAGVALGDIDLRFAWQAWHLVTSTFVCVAGVILSDIDLHFAWQARHFWHWAGSGDALGSRLPPWSPRPFAWQAWHLVTSTFVLRGRRGTYGTGLAVVTRLVLFVAVDAAALCVAGVALGDIDLRFAWQAWHLW